MLKLELADRQEDLREVRMGPPRKVAIDYPPGRRRRPV